MHISITDLELYLKCARAYKLHKLDGVMPERKSVSLCKSAAIRKVVQQLHSHSSGLKGFSVAEVETICEETWNQEIAHPLMDRAELDAIAIQAKPATKNKPAVDPVTKGQKSLEQIKTWCANYFLLEQETKVVHSNIYFTDTIGDIEFSGWIDQIREHPEEGLQAICFKTSSQSPTLMFQARDFQMSLVAHAMWNGKFFPNYPDLEKSIQFNAIPKLYYYYFPALQQYKRKNDKGNKGDFKGLPMMPVARDEKTLLEFEYEILYAASGIQIGFFPMHVNPIAGCSICSFAHKCQSAAMEIPKEMLNQEIEKISV